MLVPTAYTPLTGPRPRARRLTKDNLHWPRYARNMNMIVDGEQVAHIGPRGARVAQAVVL